MSLRNKLSESALEDLIHGALREDIGSGDITTKLLIPKNRLIKAAIILKEKATVAGLEIARKVFKAVDKDIRFEAVSADGSQEKPGKIIAKIQGQAGSILSGERTALNFLSHLSGIATVTRSFAEQVKPYKVKIMDTRKTTPGLRELEKCAVALGGGYNHRMGLWDAVLVKDNHIAVLKVGSKGINIKDIARLVKEKKPQGMKADIEVRNLKEFQEVLKIPPDIIMLDNMDISQIKKAVAMRDAQRNRQNVKIEVSGGVCLSNVKAIAKTGVDIISIGALTHSAKAVDMSLEVIE
ncbi:MAG TPA: carboxylating nicotinate-nucleotide diphosphorylase [Candidatus Omnitrophica bacterium]|nr:carboxylating nicotinate-nucleotide diphosphorylase [Candidatus Omnitrophota bacterium]